VLRVIRPEFVIGLCLSDKEMMTPGQIGLFLSLIDLHCFTRLRSLTLLDIDGRYLYLFLRHVKNCSLISLILRSRLRDFVKQEEEEEIVGHLSSIIAKPFLLHLERLTVDLSNLIPQLKWSDPESKLRYLRMRCDTGKSVTTMITRSPNLQTFALDDKSKQFSSHLHPPCARLTSLTLSSFYLDVDEVQSVLSQ
jgi:hypothetical protein